MRFISSYCIREGMVLGKSIYNEKTDLLLKKGTKMNSNYKRKIKEIGLEGIYIDDKLSKDIMMEHMVNIEIRKEAVERIKSIFNCASTGDNIDDSLVDTIEIMNNIIDDILNNDVLLVNMVDIKLFDDYTYVHSVNVAILSLIIGMSLGFNKKQLYELGIGALLHDIGKVFIPKEILNKKARLTKQEMYIIKEHSSLGYNLLKENKLISEISSLAILDHHEKWDGSGYPNNKKGKEISLYGRIISICDVYDALTSDRVYRDAMLSSEAMEYIMGGSDTHFDFDLIKVFYANVATFPLGTNVLLSDNRKAVVIKNVPGFNNRPTLKTLDNKKETLSLYNDESLMHVTITGVLLNS